MWSRDGKELFFVPAPGRFMAVAVKTTPIFTFTSSVEVPRGFGSAVPTDPRTFDIMPNGRIVGIIAASQTQGVTPAPIQVQQIQVVLNWFEELTSKVPTNQR